MGGSFESGYWEDKIKKRVALECGSALRDLPEHIVEKLSKFFKGRSGKRI